MRPQVELRVQEGMGEKVSIVITSNCIRVGERCDWRYSSPLKSARLRLAYDRANRRCRVYFGINGAAPVVELPASKTGLFTTEPFGESTAFLVLATDSAVEIDRFEVKPGLRP
jgi:hypothetical protein